MGAKRNVAYLFSGLGADHRVFQNMDFSGYEVIHITWVSPTRKETLTHYASRLLVQIKNENPILIGVSFGGIIAQELAKHIAVEKIIIISSASSSNEIPKIYRPGAWVLPMIPSFLLKWPKNIMSCVFGVSKKNKDLFIQILKDTDHKFLKWALIGITKWRFNHKINGIVQIHGSKDRLFPRAKNADYQIQGGGHFMIVEKAQEISKIVRAVLSNSYSN